MVEIAGAYGMRMWLDAARVDDPGQARRIIDHDFLRSASRRECERNCSQPRRAPAGRALLIKRLTFGAVNEPLENQGTIPDSTQSARRDRQIIAEDVKFRQLRLARKIELVRVRHADLASLDGEQLGGFFFPHKKSLHRFAQLRPRLWSNRKGAALEQPANQAASASYKRAQRDRLHRIPF